MENIRVYLEESGLNVPDSLDDNELNSVYNKFKTSEYVEGTPEGTSGLQNMLYGDLNLIDDLENGFKGTAVYDINRVGEQEVSPLLEDRGWQDPGYVNEFSTPEEIASYTEIANNNPSPAKAWFDYIIGGERSGGVQDWSTSYAEVLDGVPERYWTAIMAQPNKAAGLRTKARVMEDYSRAVTMSNRHGFSSGAAHLIGGIVDVDAPLVLMTGGGYKAAAVAARSVSLSRKVGLGANMSERLSSLAVGMNAGLQSGAAVGTVQSALRESEGWSLAVESALTTAVLGGGLNTVMKGDRALYKSAVDNEVLHSLKNVQARLHADIASGGTDYAPNLKSTLDAEAEIDFSGSIGAAKLRTDNTDIPVIGDSTLMPVSDSMREINKRSVEFVNSTDYLQRVKEDVDTLVYKIQSANIKGLHWNLGGVDSFKLIDAVDKSPTAAWLLAHVFSDASGIGVHAGNASAKVHRYSNIIAGPIADIEDTYKQWARARTGNEINVDVSLKAQFDRELYIAMNDIRIGKRTIDDIKDAELKQAVEHANKIGNNAEQFLTGHGGKYTPVDGAENIVFKNGYIPRVWKGSAIRRDIRNGVIDKDTFVADLGKSFTRMGIDSNISNSMAKAYLHRAISKSDDLDINLSNILDKDGRAYMESMLLDSGVSKEQVSGMLDHVTSKVENRNKLSNLKSRTDIDITDSIGGKQVIDYLDTNVNSLYSRYSRDVGSSAALARVGITNRSQIKEVIDTVQAELEEAGVPNLIERGRLEAMFTEYRGGIRAGYTSLGGYVDAGSGATSSILKDFTNASMLGGMVFGQLAETSALIVANGFARTWDTAVAKIFNREYAKRGDDLLEEMSVFTGNTAREHETLRHWANHDDVDGFDRGVLAQWLLNTSQSLNRIQNKYTGFDVLIGKQREAAVMLGAEEILSRVARYYDDVLPKWEEKRLRDSGLTFEHIEQLGSLINNGTIKFVKQPGKNRDIYTLDMLNEKLWSRELSDTFGDAVWRVGSQKILRILPGENASWSYTPLGSITGHLQAFAMTATNKHFFRNVRHSDPETVRLILAGLGTAFLAMKVKDIIRTGGEKDNKDIAMEAINYSNMTGWYVGYHNVMAGLIGLEDWRINGYGPTQDFKPPVLTTINRAFRLPGAAASKVLGTDNYYDDDALRVLPFSNTIYLNNMLTRD